MQINLTSEQRNKFIRAIFHRFTLFPGDITPSYFYEAFMDFIEENDIDIEEEDLVKEEKALFNYCLNHGFMGFSKLTTIMGEQKELFIKAIKRSAPSVFFHFIHYDEALTNMTISEQYEKYDGKVPAGWISTYCSCGTFYPITAEINEEITDEKFVAVEISLEDVDFIDIYSNNVLRFYMKDSGIIYECSVLSQVRSSNLFEIFKECS